MKLKNIFKGSIKDLDQWQIVISGDRIKHI